MDSVVGCRKTGLKRRKRPRGFITEMPRQETLENGVRETFILKREDEIQSKDVSLNSCEIKYHMAHAHVRRS